MNWNWFRKKVIDYPKFWESYLSHFEEASLTQKRFVVFDCETTGLNEKNDRILSIGAIAITDDYIAIKDFFEVFVSQEVFKPESVAIHGILKEGENKIVEAEAIIQFLDYIKNATLVGHHVKFDIEMINMALKRLGVGKLKNEFMDTDAMYQKLKNLPSEEHHSLDQLCDIYKIRKSDRHTASGDSFITALLFMKIKSKMNL